MKLFTRFVAALAVCIAGHAHAQANGVVVLEYHEVVKNSAAVAPSDTVVTVAQFNAQMRWLRNNGYYTVTAAQLAEHMTSHLPLRVPAGKKPIVITFDDGWKNQLNAVPGLRNNGFTATFNIIAGVPGTNASYMNWRQIRSLIYSVQADFGSHTLSHFNDWADTSRWYDEIVLSKQVIEKQTGLAVRTIAWPNGAFNPGVTTYAIANNYVGAQSIDENWCTLAGVDLSGTPSCSWLTGNAAGQNAFHIKRLFVDGRCTTAEFGKWVTQGHSSRCAGHDAPAATATVTTVATVPTAATTSLSAGVQMTMRSVRNPSSRDPSRDEVDALNDGVDRGEGDRRHEWFRRPVRNWMVR